MAVEIKRFQSKDSHLWNDFVARAKNATFLFSRDYVGYHEDRFTDHSLLIYNSGELSALFIANEAGDVIESHGGLTYGGLIIGKETRLHRVLQYFYHVVRYYSDNFKKIRYKCVPSYFQTFPSNEDLYALFLLDAKLYRRDTSMVIDRTMPISIQRTTSRSFKSYESKRYKIARSDDPQKFWDDILIPNLRDRYDTRPVHTVEEIKLLMGRFPENITLFELYDNELICGVVMFITEKTAHIQYISANEKGREANASRILVHYLSNEFKDKQWFSFGICNTDGGRQLNRGLAKWKQGFGARTFVHDFYEIDTERFILLKDYE